LLGTRLPDEEGVLLRADLPLLAIGLGPLRRLLSLLLEWVRSLPPSPERDLRKGELYGLASLVALLERVHRLGWVVLAGQAAGIDELKAWCARSLGLLDRFFLIDRQLADRLVDLDSESVDGYLGACNAALQGLIGGGIGIPPWPTAAFEDAAAPLGVAPSDLRVVLRDRIVALVRPLIGPPLPLPTDEDGFASAAGLLEYVLTYVGLDLEARLGVLETLCLPEFLAGKPGLAQIRSFRLSAAAETPWASDFTELYAKSRQIDRDGPGKGRPPDGWRTSPDFLRPSVKLAGNELGNFSAFFDPNWRANDWMWGRLDAASGLVDILLAQYRRLSPLWPAMAPSPSRSDVG
jgi:hypothetical protein